MAIEIKISNQEFEDDGRFAPPSDGVHYSVLADVIPLGVRPGGMFGDKDESVLVWLTDEKNEVTGELKDQLQWVTNSLFRNAKTGKESKLRTAVRALRGGKDLTEAEQAAPSHDIEQYIGKTVKLMTQQYETAGGKLRSKIVATKEAPAGRELLVPNSYTRDHDKPVAERLATKLGAVPAKPTPKPSAVKAAGGGRAVAAAAYRPNTTADPVEDIGF